MTSTAKKILDEALSLPEDDRRRLGERLLDSVPRESAEDVERAWDQEVLRRVKAAENGETEALDWDEAAAELRAKYTKK